MCNVQGSNVPVICYIAEILSNGLNITISFFNCNLEELVVTYQSSIVFTEENSK